MGCFLQTFGEVIESNKIFKEKFEAVKYEKAYKDFRPRIKLTVPFFFELFHEGGPYHIEKTPLIYRANQWTGFYMIGTSVIKELKKYRT